MVSKDFGKMHIMKIIFEAPFGQGHIVFDLRCSKLCYATVSGI